MAKLNTHFLRLMLIGCLVFVQAGFAAPSVKRLGGGSIYKGTNSAVNAKSDAKTTGTAGRAASIRTIGMGGKIKPTTGGTNNTSAARLSVGKYLHNAGVSAGVIRPASPSSGTPSSAALDALSLRVDELESQMMTKVDDTILNDYVTQTELQDNYYTAEQITNNYAAKDSVETIIDAISDLNTRLTAVESASGVVDPVSDWCVYGPVILVSLDPKCN